jgi:hypothetical protein
VLVVSPPSIFLPYFHANSTYNAYCIAPFFPSWLGNGTSRRAIFIGGGVPGLPGMVAGVFMVVALSAELEERNAALPARKAINAVAGLAIRIVSSAAMTGFLAAATNLAGPLRPQS